MDPLDRLDAALADRAKADAAAAAARDRLNEVIREIRQPGPDRVSQADVRRRTGWSREWIRQIEARGAAADAPAVATS